MTETESVSSPEPPKEEGQWLAPPVGGDPVLPTSEKVDPRAIEDIVDKITDGIGKLWHCVSILTHDNVWDHSQTDLWGYSIIVGWAVKKYANKSETILLGVAVMAILAVETMKFAEYAKRHGIGQKQQGGAAAAPPAGAVA